MSELIQALTPKNILSEICPTAGQAVHPCTFSLIRIWKVMFALPKTFNYGSQTSLLVIKPPLLTLPGL